MIHLIHGDLIAAQDIIVWILFTRGTFMFVSAVLMLKEPMMCGGRNQPLHRLMSVVFFTSALTCVTRAYSRAVQIVHSGTYIPASYFIVTELIALAVAIALVSKLGYDFFQWREFQKLECSKRACDKECTADFHIC